MHLEESVWDYPRPPKLESFAGHIRVVHSESVIVDSNKAQRILETSHPPSFYIPMEDIDKDYFKVNNHRTYCEYKGEASYLDLHSNGKIIRNVAWYYPKPNKNYSALANHVSFYASKLDQCFVNDELVKAQEGDFYGGWITSNIKGPFKGGPGTYGW